MSAYGERCLRGINKWSDKGESFDVKCLFYFFRIEDDNPSDLFTIKKTSCHLVKHRLLKLSFCGVILWMLTACVTQPVIVVSPNGNDKGSGTQDKPFSILERAQEEVEKQLLAQKAGTIKVLLQKGVYEISEPLALTAKVPIGGHQQVVWMAAEGAAGYQRGLFGAGARRRRTGFCGGG